MTSHQSTGESLHRHIRDLGNSIQGIHGEIVSRPSMTTLSFDMECLFVYLFVCLFVCLLVYMNVTNFEVLS